MTVIARFQGSIDVPLFAAPYTVPAASGISINGPGVSGVGDQCLVSGRTHTATNKCQFYGVTKYGFTTLAITDYATYLATYASLSTMLIGRGTFTGGATYSDESSGNPYRPVMFENNIVFPAFATKMVQQLPSTNWITAAGAALAFTPFATNKTVGALKTTIKIPEVGVFSCGAATNVNSTTISNIEPASTAAYAAVGPCVAKITGPNFEIDVKAFVSSINSGLASQGHYAQFHIGLQSGISAMGLVLDSTSFDNDFFILPDYRQSCNFAWAGKSTGGIRRSQFTAQYDIPTDAPSIQLISSSDTWQTDDPVINAAITGGQVLLQPCANGFILGTVAAGANDWFVSPDGTKYWAINLRIISSSVWLNPTNAGKQPGNAIRSQASSWIDPQGVYFYMGPLTQNAAGTVSQMAYSLGFNIPWKIPSLPNIPPMAMPCWSPCLDRVGGRPGNISPTGN